MNNAIQRINRYPVDGVVSFVNTYLLDSDLSCRKRYPRFEQPGLTPSSDLAAVATYIGSRVHEYDISASQLFVLSGHDQAFLRLYFLLVIGRATLVLIESKLKLLYFPRKEVYFLSMC